jgi:hypothetical protein
VPVFNQEENHMQKKLIALAVAGLASTGAFAQANVTVYGVADATFDVVKIPAMPTTTWATPPAFPPTLPTSVSRALKRWATA